MMHEVLENLRCWQARRRAIRQLHAMPDHLLADIGIERGNIEDVVHGLQRRQRVERPATAPLPASDAVLSRG